MFKTIVVILLLIQVCLIYDIKCILEETSFTAVSYIKDIHRIVNQ